MKKSFWTIALSLILFVTACGAKPTPIPANETLIPTTMEYKVDLTELRACGSNLGDRLGMAPSASQSHGPLIVVYTKSMPLIVIEPGVINISLPEYYWTDVYQDKRIPPVLNGPFGAINIATDSGGDYACWITWQEWRIFSKY